MELTQTCVTDAVALKDVTATSGDGRMSRLPHWPQTVRRRSAILVSQNMFHASLATHHLPCRREDSFRLEDFLQFRQFFKSW